MFKVRVFDKQLSVDVYSLLICFTNCFQEQFENFGSGTGPEF
jgi:hypothetical protein